jgi:diacylglycerol kinase family enzyme
MERTATRRGTLALVLNEKSGALLGQDAIAGTLTKNLATAGFDITSPPQGDLPDRIRQAHAHGADLIVVAGGDGTVACAATVLANTGAALGIIPAGTANLLARDLGIPPDDHEAAIRILTDGHRRAIDVGDIEGQFFLCALMLGSPARLGHHREIGRRRGNGLAAWLHFGRAFLRATLRHRAITFHVTVDGTRHRLRTPALTIAVNALDDTSGRLFGRSRLDGGLLWLYAVRPRSAFALLRLGLRAASGRIAEDPTATILRGEHITIAGPTASLRVLIDGEEHLLPSPATMTLKKKALTVMAAAA